jgi:hypothetical protein
VELRFQAGRVDIPRMDSVPEVNEVLAKLFTRLEIPELTGRLFSAPYDTCPSLKKAA